MFLKRSFFFVACFSLLFLTKAHAQTVVSFADAVETVLPSVVSVSSFETEAEPPEMMMVLRGSPFEQFFKNVYKDGGFDTPKSILLGSGFVYDANGHLVTNAHVVANLKDVVVTLNNGTALNAKVIGRDVKTDLAVLKVDEKDLPPVTFGQSDLAKVGESVIAVGNPFGLGNSVTSGIISARSRDIQVGPYDDFLQTDAAINRGNSGGPLFNAKGEMIGVNTAIFSPSGGSVGIAFAVPSKLVKRIADSLIKYGEVKTGRLGLKLQTLSPEIAKREGLKEASGAFVAGIDMSSEAKNSSVQVGDVVLAFNGKKIKEIKDLTTFVALADIGSTANLTVFRNGKQLVLPITISELKEKQERSLLPMNSIENAQNQKIGFLGVNVAELTPKMRQKYDLEKQLEGLVVVDVQPQTDAFVKGLKEGDVLVELDKKAIASFEDLKEWQEEISELGQDSSFVLIHRKSHRFFAVIRYTQN